MTEFRRIGECGISVNVGDRVDSKGMNPLRQGKISGFTSEMKGVFMVNVVMVDVDALSIQVLR
jgi:hypothetical protein